MFIWDSTDISSLCRTAEEVDEADDDEEDDDEELLVSDVTSGARARHSSIVGREFRGSSWLDDSCCNAGDDWTLGGGGFDKVI